jgi:hypothetical protein
MREFLIGFVLIFVFVIIFLVNSGDVYAVSCGSCSNCDCCGAGAVYCGTEGVLGYKLGNGPSCGSSYLDERFLCHGGTWYECDPDEDWAWSPLISASDNQKVGNLYCCFDDNQSGHWDLSSCGSGTPDSEAAKIGSMYNCQPNTEPNAYLIVGNIGYDFVGDEMSYAYAKLWNEKGCHKVGNEKYVIFYVSTVNFPSNGTPSGSGRDIEQGWLDYWDYNARRFSDLGYNIIIHPQPFIIKDSEPNLDYPPDLRPLVRSDLNLAPSEIPVVFECRDGRKTVLASIYDPRTLGIAVKFYEGIKDFFSKYPSFVKISIVPPSDFGDYGFPSGVQTRWWWGSDAVGDCYLTGDVYARQIIASDPPTYEQYSGKLNEFRQALTQQVKALFPDKRYVVYMGYGSDTNPRDGFSYQEVTAFAVANGIELHSSHGRGLDYDDFILSQINVNRPEDYELTLEDAGLLNEFLYLRSFCNAAKNDVDGLVLYSVFFYDNFYLAHLLYSMGPSGNENLYPDKNITFDSANGLGSLRSSHFFDGYMDMPKNGDSIDGDVENHIGGWGYYEAPYGDHQYYGVQVYAGHLIEGSTYKPDIDWSDGMHPEYMRLVGSAVTTSERCGGCGDTSRFGLNWKPNLAKGKAVLRIFFVNGDSQIIAEHPNSPMIVNINSRYEGNATLDRLNYDYGLNDFCERDFRMRGYASDSQNPGSVLNITIVDEYRGTVLAEGETDASGSFSIDFTVGSSGGEETRVVVPRAYVYTGSELVALQTNIVTPNIGGYPKLTSHALNTLVNCSWRLSWQTLYYIDADGDGYGNPLVSLNSTAQPSGYVSNNLDCDDDNYYVNPGVNEILYNGLDDDCNSSTKDIVDGDLNNDSKVDILDLTIVTSHFGLNDSDQEWNATADVVPDSIIDIYDVVFVASRFT